MKAITTVMACAFLHANASAADFLRIASRQTTNFKRMSKFRKKPVVIDAFKLGDPWPDWFHEAVIRNDVITHLNKNADGKIVGTADIRAPEGTMTAAVGAWIIRGVKGEIYPCMPDLFEATYEPAA
jgi:hypothetical protein